MNCKEAILDFMSEANVKSSYQEFTSAELANRVGKDAQGDGPEYSVTTIRRSLMELYAHDKVKRRRIGNKSLWRLPA